MKVNWFSPVPPAPSDIGNFTRNVVPSLARHMDVTVWTDGAGFDPAICNGVPIRSCENLDRVWPEINFADFTIYNIGNDARFHAHYAQMLEQHPGIVILHDYNLHELHRERHVHNPNGKVNFLRYVGRIAGPEGVEIVQKFNQGQIDFRECVEKVPLVGSVTRFARGLISFNKAMEPALSEQSKLPMMFCPLPLQSEERIPPVTERSHQRGEPIELVMFGYLNSPNRRLQQVLQAVATYRGGPLRLTLFGHIAARDEFQQMVKNLGIVGKVRFLGFIPEKQLGEVMRQSHLAINLRNPSRGESSGALLRAWNHALPMLVSSTGYYTTLPEGLVCPVATDNEVAGIHQQLDAFIKNPGEYFAIGQAGHRYLQDNHTTEQFAGNLVQFLEMAAPSYQRGYVGRFAARMGKRVAVDFGHPTASSHFENRLAQEMSDWIGPPAG